MPGRATPFVLIALLAGGCISGSTSLWKRIEAAPWRLVALEGRPVVADPPIVLHLEGESRLFGEVGASRYFGSYERVGRTGIRMGRVAGTHASGASALRERERRYLDLVERADEVRLAEDDDGPALELLERGRVSLRFVPAR